MKRRIAITGGRGRLAGVTAAYFRQQGYEVTLFSRKEGDGMKALAALLDPKVMSSFGTLIHAAWSTVPFTSEENPGREEREDIPLLKNILETLHYLKNQTSIPKFIFISSAAVYGNQKKERAIEQSLCNPLSGYARAKFFAERLILQAVADDAALHAVILRVTNLLGIPSSAAFPQGILPKIMEAAKNHRELELWGDGKGSKDYLWIDDFLEGLKITVETSIQGIFNIGSGKNFSLLELIKIVEEKIGRPLSIKYHPPYPWDVSSSQISSAAFIEATGWKPRADIVKKIESLLHSC